jgi:hypothetical protein
MKVVGYLAAALIGLVLFGTAATQFTRWLDPGAPCSGCDPAGLRALPEARLLPPNTSISDEYTVDGSDVVDTEPALVRRASAPHSEAAIAGFFAGELAQLGWTRTATAAPAKDAIASFTAGGMHWAKGDLRFDLSFQVQIITPAAGAPLSFTVRITRIRPK